MIDTSVMVAGLVRNHEFLIAITCRDHGLPLETLDRRQAALASRLHDLETSLLLPDG